MDSIAADPRDAAGSGSDGSVSDVTLPPAMAPVIVSEDTAVAVVMDRLDALSVSRAANAGGEIRPPAGVRI
jgi:hypothetical protein